MLPFPMFSKMLDLQEVNIDEYCGFMESILVYFQDCMGAIILHLNQ